MYDIYHETAFENLESILKYQTLFKSSELNSRGRSGQGSVNRRLAQDPTISLVNRTFYDSYDEVDAVYFRLKTHKSPIELVYNEVLLLFSGSLLDDHDSVINTEENFGFMIRENGKEGESQFSGNMGISIFNKERIDILYNLDFDHRRSEIAVLDNVCLKYLKCIYMKTKYRLLAERKVVGMCKQLDIPIIYL